MQKLTLKRRASGIHAVHAPDGEALGVIDPSDLQLNDDELSELLQKHVARRAAQGAAHEFIRRVKERMQKTGADYGAALHEIASSDPMLAAEYRAEVLGSHLL